VLDTTDFATFIDTGSLKAPIAQRGKAKQNAPKPQHCVRLGELLQMGRRGRGLSPPMRSMGIKIAAEGAMRMSWLAVEHQRP